MFALIYTNSLLYNINRAFDEERMFNVKVLNQKVSVLVYSDKEGNMKPLRIKLDDENMETQTIKIESSILVDTIKLCGERYHLYKCQAVIRGCMKIFELRYNMDKIEWILFKI